jgi:cyclase
MLRTRVMPCLLLQDGRLVKTTKFRSPSYVGDPINAIKIFNEKEVDELIVLDISATAEGREPNYALLEDLASECFMPICYGGGVRSMDQLQRIFSMGYEKVALNSYAAERPEFLSEAAAKYGSQSIVASIDVRRGLFGGQQVVTRSGRHKVSGDPVGYARKMQEVGAGEILLYAVDRDGTWQGFDLELVAAVVRAVSVPVIASGGAGSLSDISAVVHTAGASAVALGSMTVFQAKGLGVLINFPKRLDLEGILEQRGAA